MQLINNDGIGGNFLANYSYEEIQDLNKSLMSEGFVPHDGNGFFGKAFTSGEGTGSAMTDLDQLTGGRAITIENIDRSLKYTAEDRSDLVWEKLLRRSPIYAVLDQYMVLSDHGVNAKRRGFGTFRKESAFPKAKDVTLNRKVDSTKFLRDMRDLSHVAEVTTTMADKHEILNRAGATTVLEAAELAYVTGNSAAQPTEYDGFIKKALDAEVAGFDSFIDCRDIDTRKSAGALITEKQLEKGARLIRNSFGSATHLVLPSIVKSDLNELLHSSRRIYGNNAEQVKGLMAGLPVSGFRSDHAHMWGDGQDAHFKFASSIETFFPSGEGDDSKAPSADFPSSDDAPTLPSAVVVTVENDATSEFKAGDAGTYYYQVASISADGITAVADGDTTAAVLADKKVKLVITVADSNVTGFSIYRSKLGASDNSDCRWIADIKCDNTAGDTDFYDTNLMLPGTSVAVMISNAPQTDALDVRQLMPFIRMQLPFGLNGIVGTPYLYMLYCYLRTPKYRIDRTGGTIHKVFKNIGTTDSSF